MKSKFTIFICAAASLLASCRTVRKTAQHTTQTQESSSSSVTSAVETREWEQTFDTSFRYNPGSLQGHVDTRDTGWQRIESEGFSLEFKADPCTGRATVKATGKEAQVPITGTRKGRTTTSAATGTASSNSTVTANEFESREVKRTGAGPLLTIGLPIVAALIVLFLLLKAYRKYFPA